MSRSSFPAPTCGCAASCASVCSSALLARCTTGSASSSCSAPAASGEAAAAAAAKPAPEPSAPALQSTSIAASCSAAACSSATAAGLAEGSRMEGSPLREALSPSALAAGTPSCTSSPCPSCCSPLAMLSKLQLSCLPSPSAAGRLGAACRGWASDRLCRASRVGSSTFQEPQCLVHTCTQLIPRCDICLCLGSRPSVSTQHPPSVPRQSACQGAAAGAVGGLHAPLQETWGHPEQVKVLPRHACHAESLPNKSLHQSLPYRRLQRARKPCSPCQARPAPPLAPSQPRQDCLLRCPAWCGRVNG